MKRLLLMLGLLTSMTLHAQTPLTAEQIKAAQDSATALAGTTRAVGATVNADGSLAIDPSTGKAVLNKNGASDTTGQMAYVQSITGVTGAQTSGQANKKGVGDTSLSATGGADFSCAREKGSRKAIAGRVVKLTNCAYTNNTVTTVTLAVCSATAQGGVCDEKSFSEPTTVSANSYGTVGGMQVGVGCNDANLSCRVTLTTNYSVTGNSDNLEQQAKQNATATGGNSGRAILEQTVSSEKYTTSMAQQGQSLKECIEQNTAKLGSDGAVQTCNGQYTSQIAEGSNSTADCTTGKECIRKAYKTYDFTRTCIRTIALTGATCGFDVPTRQCAVTATKVGGLNMKNGGTYESKFDSSDCAPDILSSATKVGVSEAVCAADVAGATEEENVYCPSKTFTEYYAWPQNATRGACAFDPLPLSSGTLEGSCSLSTNTVQETCAGEWFGRTLSTAECTITDTSDGEVGTFPANYTRKAGCGICTKPIRGYTCYGKPTTNEPEDSCATANLTGCSLAGSEVLSATDGGLVTSQRDTYQCKQQDAVCVEYAQTGTNQCLGANMTNGLETARFKGAASDPAMGEALANLAVMNQLTQGAGDSVTMPKVFGGTQMSCEKPTGGIGSWVYQDCCKISLERPTSKGAHANSCSENDAKLAAARRAHYDKFLDETCSKKTKFPRTCIRKKQRYCVFDGMLSRIIHEQGVQQLANLASSSAGADMKRQTMAFNYYSGNGQWSAPITVNGTQVSAWQYPAYCSSLGDAEKKLQSDPMANECPVKLVQYFAACDKPQGCGALPQVPEFGSETWTIQGADPLKDMSTAISRYSAVKGACDTNSSKCSYEVSAWPAGVGGRALITKTLTFPLYQVTDNTATQLTVAGDIVSAGDIMLQPFSLRGTSGALPATVQIKYSSNGGQAWQTATVSTSMNQEVTLAGSTIRLIGSCNALSNMCEYRATGEAIVQTKTWDDCSGFTMNQLSVLDIGKMDLSEWVASATDKMADSSAANAGSATNAFQAYNSTMGGSATVTISTPSPSGATFARVYPSEGFGPFNVEVKVGGYWPYTSENPEENTDLVTGASVTWGDCTATDTLRPASQKYGPSARGFYGLHTYQAPDKVCGDGLQANRTHTVTVAVYTTKSGSHTMTMKVENAWSTMPGTGSSGKEQNNANNGKTLTGGPTKP